MSKRAASSVASTAATPAGAESFQFSFSAPAATANRPPTTASTAASPCRPLTFRDAPARIRTAVAATALTAEEIETEFGAEVARLVEGVTKLGRISIRTDQQQQAENIRKMMVAM